MSAFVAASPFESFLRVRGGARLHSLLSACLPRYLLHPATLIRDVSVLGQGRTPFPRLATVRADAVQCEACLLRDMTAPRSRWRWALVGEAR